MVSLLQDNLHHCKSKDSIGVLASPQEKLSFFVSIQQFFCFKSCYRPMKPPCIHTHVNKSWSLDDYSRHWLQCDSSSVQQIRRMHNSFAATRGHHIITLAVLWYMYNDINGDSLNSCEAS